LDFQVQAPSHGRAGGEGRWAVRVGLSVRGVLSIAIGADGSLSVPSASMLDTDTSARPSLQATASTANVATGTLTSASVFASAEPSTAWLTR